VARGLAPAVAGILALAVLLRGGVTDLGLAIVAAAVLGLTIVAWRRGGLARGTSLDRVLACLLGLVALQVLPLPTALAELISPHGERLRALYGVGGGAFTTLSLVPAATASGLAQLLVYVAAFASVAGLVEDEDDVVRVARAVLGVGTALAAVTIAIRLAELGWNAGDEETRTLAWRHVGLFINNNNIANFLALCVCVGLGLLVRRAQAGGGSRPLAAAIALCVCGIFFAGSRGGFLALASGVGFFVAAEATRRGGAFSAKHVRRATLGLVFFVAASLIVLTAIWYRTDRVSDVLNRYAYDDTIPAIITRVYDFLFPYELRWYLWEDGFRIARDFPIVGTGLETFDSVYPSYKRITRFLRFTHIENEYFQTIVELGFAGLLTFAWGVVRFFRRTLPRTEGDPLRTAFVAGVFASLAHSIFDFNYHIPANGLLVAILAALALRGDGVRRGRWGGRAILGGMALAVVILAGRAALPNAAALGMEQAALRELEEARASFEVALELDFLDARSRRDLAWTLGELGLQAEAIQEAQLATIADRTNPYLHRDLARMLRRAGKRADAAHFYDLARRYGEFALEAGDLAE
jgi:O-antigen ligase